MSTRRAEGQRTTRWGGVPKIGGGGGGGGGWVYAGLLKICSCCNHCWFFNTKIKGNHHLQGNVQV